MTYKVRPAKLEEGSFPLLIFLRLIAMCMSTRDHIRESICQMPEGQKILDKVEHLESLPPPSVIFTRNTSSGEIVAIPKTTGEGCAFQDHLAYALKPVEDIDKALLEEVTSMDQTSKVAMFSALLTAGARVLQQEEQAKHRYEDATKDTEESLTRAATQPNLTNKKQYLGFMHRQYECAHAFHCSSRWRSAIQKTNSEILMHVRLGQNTRREAWQAYHNAMRIALKSGRHDIPKHEQDTALRDIKLQLKLPDSKLSPLPSHVVEVAPKFWHKTSSNEDSLCLISEIRYQAAPGLPSQPLDLGKVIDWPQWDSKLGLKRAPWLTELVNVSQSRVDSQSTKSQPYRRVLEKELKRTAEAPKRLAMHRSTQGPHQWNKELLSSTLHCYRKEIADLTADIGLNYLRAYKQQVRQFEADNSANWTPAEVKAYQAITAHEMSIALTDCLELAKISEQYVKPIDADKANDFTELIDQCETESQEWSLKSKNLWTEAEKEACPPELVKELWERSLVKDTASKTSKAKPKKKKKKKQKSVATRSRSDLIDIGNTSVDETERAIATSETRTDRPEAVQDNPQTVLHEPTTPSQDGPPDLRKKEAVSNVLPSDEGDCPVDSLKTAADPRDDFLRQAREVGDEGDTSEISLFHMPPSEEEPQQYQDEKGWGSSEEESLIQQTNAHRLGRRPETSTPANLGSTSEDTPDQEIPSSDSDITGPEHHAGEADEEDAETGEDDTARSSSSADMTPKESSRGYGIQRSKTFHDQPDNTSPPTDVTLRLRRSWTESGPALRAIDRSSNQRLYGKDRETDDMLDEAGTSEDEGGTSEDEGGTNGDDDEIELSFLWRI